MDDGKIVRLVPRTAEHNDGVIQALENMLAEARADSGLLGVAIAVVYADGSTGTCFEPGDNLATLIGATARLQSRLIEYEKPL